MNIPTMQEALKLFDEGMLLLARTHPHYPSSILNTYRSHATLVAFCAEIIASKIQEMDCRQAYILGLLHDYGKFTIVEEHGKEFVGLFVLVDYVHKVGVAFACFNGYDC